MNGNDKHRPRVFRLDDPAVSMAGEEDVRPRGAVVVTPEPDFVELETPEIPVPPRRRSRWGTVFWSGVGALLALAVSLSVSRLIDELFTYAEWLGWLGIAISAVTVLAFVVIAARELSALWRLEKIEHLHRRATEIIVADDRDAARTLVRELVALYAADPRTARARGQVEMAAGDIVDGADLVRIAERELMGPIDERARQIIADAAKRVSIVTAVSPRAAVDMLFVAAETLRMVRRLARLYGGRPGGLGLARLLRHALGNLALTGGMAAGDSLLSEVLGHGVASRISAKLGEGVLNGLLTARLGLAAMAATRPLPFVALDKPNVRDVAGGLLSRAVKAEKDAAG